MFKGLDINNVVLLANTLATVVVLVLTYIARRDISTAKDDIRTSKEDIRKVEIATNSMKDALVKSTADASFAAGNKEARIEGERKAELLEAQGARAPAAPIAPVPVEVVKITPVDVKASVPIEIKREDEA